MSVSAIKVQDLTVFYQNSEVLSGVSLEIALGDYVGIVGPNGSGKTTLIKSMVGLIEPAQGNIEILGTALAAFTKWSSVGYLPQKNNVMDPRFPANVYEVIASGILSAKRFPKILNKQDQMRIENTLEILNIVDLRDHLIGRLSGGQQQRVMLARALVNQPSILLLDEPTVALDPHTRESFYTLLQKLNKEQNITILLVSHDPVTVGNFATKLLYLDKKVIFYGKFGEFCSAKNMKDYFGLEAQHLMCHQH
ncbi:MAG: metal ABC transporter ATP-binding protein [Candidatus Omnitrophica bacterium]|nr:metal ABC transporter ATP-binding protein [Candidatus Omnitrophota bacterium]